VVRASVLLRRGQREAAEAELWLQLRQTPDHPEMEAWAEAAALKGLARLASSKGTALVPEYARRLTELEAEFRAAESSSPGTSTLASAFSLVDTEAAIDWMRAVKPQNTCDIALQRATLLRDASRLDEASRAIEECPSRDLWVKRCAEMVLHQIPGAPVVSVAR